MPGAAAFHVEVGAAAAVASENAVENAEAFVIGFQENAAGAVAEDDAGGAVAVIDDAAHFVAADDDDLLIAAAFDIHGAGSEGIYEAGAGGGHIESPGVLSAGLVANNIRGSGEEHVGRNGGDDHAIDLFGVDASLFADLQQNRGAEIGCGFSFAPSVSFSPQCPYGCGSIRRWCLLFSRGRHWSVGLRVHILRSQ